MVILYRVLYAAGLLAAVLFTLVVMINGKGDAMGGGTGVRTTFKGKANFDDFMSKWTLYLGAALFVLVLGVDIMVSHTAAK